MALCAEKRGPSTRRGVPCRCLFYTCLLVAIPMPAAAFELSGGVSLGAIVFGTDPRLAVSPHASVSWRMESGFLFAAHDLLNIVPATNKDGVGVRNQVSAAFGYASEKANFSLGPSLSLYSVATCGIHFCGRLSGVAPGGHAQISVYFGSSFGLTMNANVDWLSGESYVLPSGAAVTILAGPVFRWRSN